MSRKGFSSSERCLIDDADTENIRLHRAESTVPNEEVVVEKSADETDKPQDNHNAARLVLSAARNFCAEFNYLKVEVVMFLYLFSHTMRSVTSTDLMMDKVCLVHLKRSDYDCAHRADESLVELLSEVAQKATNFHVGYSMISMLPSVLLSVFIGSWSDKYGRKAPLVVALAGTVADGLGVTLCAHFYRSRVEYMYVTAALQGVSGGLIGVSLVLYAYASDLSNVGNRTLRYALLEMAFALSMPLGSLFGRWIFRLFGFVPVFLSSTCGHIACLCWVVFMLEETKGLDTTDSWMTKFFSFWSLESFGSAFNVTANKRPNQQIGALMLAMSISIVAVAPTASIGFIYVFHLYKWDYTKYSTVSSVFTIVGVVVLLVVVPLSKRFQVRDVILGVAGSLSLVAKMVCTGVAVNHHLYYLASFLGLFSGLGTVAGRSKISKITPKDDLGKVFAFLSIAEWILPIIAAAIIVQAFNASWRFFPGLVYVVMGAFSVIPVLIFVWISRLPNANIDSEAEDHSTSDALPRSENIRETEPASEI